MSYFNTLDKTDNAPAAAPVTVDSTENGVVIVKKNNKRKSVTLQNTGTVACLIRFGGNPSATAYNLILSGGAVAKDGTGGSITIREFTGEIKGITESGSTTIAVTELI
jgi:hypothetical protein